MASTLETLLRRFGVNVATSAFKRQVEETLQPILERAIHTGMDENATLREMALATRNIPGLRVASHAAVSAAGGVLAEYADDLWPGDDRAFTRTMRAALKRLGPQLHFASEIGADALERAVKEKADGIISPATTAPADRKAELDMGVFLWPGEFPNQLLVPARNDDGTIRYDGQNVPIILDPRVMALRYQPKYTTPTTRTVSGGKGQPSRQVTDPPQRPEFIGPFALRDAVQMVDMGRWDPTAAEAIQRLLAPKPGHFASWGDDVWDVIRARNATLARRSRETGYDWLANEESEGLAKSLAQGKVDVTIIKELIGRAFKPRIGTGGAPAGELTFEAVDELEQIVFDQWAGGEQPLHTKVIRHFRRIQRSGAIRGVSPLSVMWAALGVSSILWMPLVGMIMGLLLATLMFVWGIFLPAGGTTQVFGLTADSAVAAFVLTFLSGWLAFAVTWTFPAFEAATACTGLKPDWLKSLGRRIAGLGLTVCSTMIPLAIHLGITPEYRALILAGVGFVLGMGFNLIEADLRYRVTEMMDKTAPKLNAVFGGGLVAYGFIGGYISANPAKVKHVTDWFSGLTVWHWLGLGAFALFALFVAAMLFGGSKEEGKAGTSDRALNLASMLLGGGAFLAVLFLGGWLCLAGLHEIGSWFGGGSASATSPVPVQTDNGPVFDKAALCADPLVPVHQRNILNCP